MYLLNLDNQAYFYITLIFASIFGIAYYYRKTSDMTYQSSILVLSGFGIFEFILYAYIGAKFGLSGLVYVVVSNIIATILVVLYKKIMHNTSFAPKNIYLLIINLLVCVILILILSASISLFAKLSYMIVGFKFANGALAMSLFALICMLIGGRRAAVYNIRWLTLFSLFIILYAIGLAFYQNSMHFRVNLNELSINQAHIANYYTAIHFNISSIILITVFSLFIFCIRVSDLIFYTISTAKILKNSFFTIVLSAIFACVGIISIATPSNLSNQGQSITYQAQLADGQTAYVVKSIETKDGKSINPNPGLIPQMLDAKTYLPLANKYEYLLASNVMLQHYLPPVYNVFSFIVLMLTILVSIFIYGFITTHIIRLQFLKYYPQYDVSELTKRWVWRIILVAVCCISLVIAVIIPRVC